MSTPSITIHEGDLGWDLPARGLVGMYRLIAAETAIFTIFVVAYIFYIGKSVIGPQPRDVLHLPMFLTVCLLSSSLTIHLAVRLLRSGRIVSFGLWWLLTTALRSIFLLGTLREWRHLIYDEGLTIQTNLFHLITSLPVGLLYGAMLPMLPRRPILLGGFIAPLFWTGLIHSILGVVNPILNQRIHWLWFVASQVAFGIVAGILVSRQERIRTWQRMPLAYRSGMEASGLKDEGR